MCGGPNTLTYAGPPYGNLILGRAFGQGIRITVPASAVETEIFVSLVDEKHQPKGEQVRISVMAPKACPIERDEIIEEWNRRRERKAR
jgi:sRNA-binding carbon storage regulator CsrA